MPAGRQLARLFVTVGADTREFQQKMDGMAGTLRQTGQQLTSIGKNLSLKVTAPIVGMLGIATKGAAELEGAISKFDVVFGEFSEEMHAWVGTFREEFPLARREIIAHGAALQDLLVPMGVARGDAKDMTQEWMHLAGALAAFNDVPIEQALEAIRSGIAGQSRPLRQFGINANVAALEQTALAHGLIETGEEMNDQVRQQALLLQAYEQSSDAVNGLEEQKGSLLWVMQEFRATLKDLGDSFGTILLPHVTRLMEGLVVLLQQFDAMDERLKVLIVVVATMAAALGPLLIVVGQILTAISTILPYLPKLATAFKVVKGAVVGLAVGAGAPLVILGAVIAGLGVALYLYRDQVTEVLAAVWSLFSDTFSRIVDFLRGIDLAEIGRNIVRSLTRGIRDMISGPVDAVRDMGESLRGAVTDFFGISSPSRLMIELGEDIGKGLEVGVRHEMPNVRDITSTLSGGQPALAGLGGGNGGPLLQIEHMSVRDDRDIDTLVEKIEHRQKLKERRVGT